MMKLQQLRYIWEIRRHDLNVSATAEELFTSQPGISKQVRQLEEELGVDLFIRQGKQLTGLTEAGQEIVELAGQILARVEDIRHIAQEFSDHQRGTFALATTHTQARYVLPPVLQTFMQRYPNISLHVHQGTPVQIAEMAAKGGADLAIATEAMDLFENLVMLPCYRWTRCVLVRHDHPLAQSAQLTLQELARWPLITYVFGFTGRSQLDHAFNHAGVQPNVVLTAVDADVIKTYVRLGLGVGIVAKMAWDAQADADLVALDAGHLFGASVTKIGVRRDAFLRAYLYEFMAMFAPHLTRTRIDQAMRAKDKHELEQIFAAVELPCY